MGDLSISQIDFLIKTLKEQKCLEIFKLEDKEKLWAILKQVSQGQKRLLHHLIISNKNEKLIDVMDQLGIERK